MTDKQLREWLSSIRRVLDQEADRRDPKRTKHNGMALALDRVVSAINNVWIQAGLSPYKDDVIK